MIVEWLRRTPLSVWVLGVEADTLIFGALAIGFLDSGSHMDVAVVCSLIGLSVAIGVHIAIIARWSGRIDAFLAGNTERLTKAEAEIIRLRDARHEADGLIAMHEGILREIGLYRQAAQATHDNPSK